MVNPNITAEVVEANEFPSRARKYAVRGVPKTVVNDGALEFVGAQPESVQVQTVLRAAGVDADLEDDEEEDPSG
jgi:predicted DsbA family dithiol-disulfide isomerase